MNKDDFEVCRFNGKIKALDKDDFSSFGISQASLDEKAKSLMPNEFNPEDNIDVIPVVFNLAVVNEFNKNGDGIGTETAMAAVKRFVNKPINVEHQKQKIVGHMINASFSEEEFDFKDNDINSYAGKTEPFYINAAGFIYSHVYPELAEAILESSDKGEDAYQSISTSWELAFSQYKIAEGSNKLSECRVLSESDAEKQKEYVKGFGGEGLNSEGNPVNRLIVGKTYPLGAALTTNPAARVKGIYMNKKEMDEEMEDKQNKESLTIYQKEKISLNNVNPVNKEKFNILNHMTKEEFEKLMDGVAENVASVVKKDDQANSIGEIMRDALNAHGENWKSKIQLETEAKEKARADLESLQASFKGVKEELDGIKSEMEAKASVELFNDRMNFIDQTYSLQEKELEHVVAEMKGIDNTSESFEALKDKLAVVFSHRNKEAIAKAEQEVQERVEELVASTLESAKKVESEVSEASVEDEDLQTTDEETSTIPNNTAEASTETSLVEKLKNNFQVQITK